MALHILKYRLDPKIYGIQSNGNPYKTGVDDFTIYEEFKINPSYNKINIGLGDYTINIESKVHDTRELQKRYFDTSQFVDILDRSWIYVCLHPLTKKEFAFMGPHVHWPDGNLYGWSSNFDGVEKEFNKGKAHIKVSFKSMPNASFSYWPLKKALEVREKILMCSEVARSLIDLHYISLSVNSDYAMLFFLAKGLELVRSLLPGKNNEAKEKELPIEIRKRLHSSFNHILDLSNSRYEIRHIVKNPNEKILHPKMTNEEIKTFKNDSDLIIRAVVCMELDIDLIIPDRE